MLLRCVLHTFFLLSFVHAIQLPYINNTILQPGYISNSILLANLTCHQCLCTSSLSYPAVNCFSNNTCQLFATFPPVYKIKYASGARLYYPQRLFPNASQCCMPDMNYLLNKLRMATTLAATVINPREMVIDNHGYVTTIEMKSSYLDRLNPANLSLISRTTIQMSSARTIAYNNGSFFVASNTDNYITVIDSGNLTGLSNITLTLVNGPRAIMFLNNSQTMVISSINNNYLVFLDKSSDSPITYTFSFYQVLNCTGPHGLSRVNDSFFYATSYTTNAIYSYSRVSSSWKENYVFTAFKLNNSTGATHLTIDECQRSWLSLETDTTWIYDQQGNLLGNLTIANTKIFDLNIMNNYVIYVSDSNANRTVRLDPNIQC